MILINRFSGQGKLFTFGFNNCGQCGRMSEINQLLKPELVDIGKSVVMCAAGSNHSLVLTDGGLFSFGLGKSGQLGLN